MDKFWLTKTLEQMTVEEWEKLCDGCGLCCLVKLEDDESGEVQTSSLSCRQLDLETCRCKDYQNRLEKVSMCRQLSLENISSMQWLPDSCAYKRLYKGETLPDWHPLVSGNKNSVYEAGISVNLFALSEEYIHPDQLADYLLEL